MAKGTGTADADRPQSRRKGKDTAPSQDTERPQSRRKDHGAVDDTTPKRPFFDRRRIITTAIALAFLILVFVVTQKDGGAPQEQAFAAQPRPAIVGWTYAAQTAGGDTDVLCTDDAAPCDPDELWRHHAAGNECEIDARIWLSGSGMPIVLRDVRVVMNGTAWAGDYTLTSNNTTDDKTPTSPINITTTWTQRPEPWDNGWWWRVESEHVRISLMVPCDTHTAKIDLRISASHLDGDAWTRTESTRLTLHDEYLATLGQLPR